MIYNLIITQKEFFILKIFIYFLKKENSLGKYIANVNSKNGSEMRIWYHNTDDILNFLQIGLHKYNGLHLINFAFKWSDTDEGDNFWQKLSSKWEKISKSLI
jgi:hypothetical protein